MSEEAVMRRLLESAAIDASQEVLGKAREMLRKINMRMPAGSMKKAEACRPSIAVELACRLSKLSFDKTKLLAQVPVQPKVYQDAVTACINVLHLELETKSVIDTLGLRFGTQLTAVAHGVLEQYRVSYVETLEPHQKAHVDLATPVYQTAAFYVGARTRKVVLDKNQLTTITNVNASFFRQVVDSMLRVVAADDGGEKRAAGRKAKRQAKNDGGGGSDGAPHVPAGGHCSSNGGNGRGGGGGTEVGGGSGLAESSTVSCNGVEYAAHLYTTGNSSSSSSSSGSSSACAHHENADPNNAVAAALGVPSRLSYDPEYARMKKLESLGIKVAPGVEAAEKARLEEEKVAREEERRAAERARYEAWREGLAAKRRKPSPQQPEAEAESA
jgi:hypothetical protein